MLLDYIKISPFFLNSYEFLKVNLKLIIGAMKTFVVKK